MIQLSKRLQAVAELAACGKCVADVGTDHGYLPIRLVEQGIADRAIAMDVRMGPLQRAQEHIREHQLGAYIETRLSDGLAALHRDEAQVIVIAGMGGATMRGILEAGSAVISPDTILVLQPQSELYEFRGYLVTHEFRLLAENMVEEDGKYYPMMKVQKGCDAALPYTEQELRYGPLLLRQRHPVLKEFLRWQLRQKERISEQIRSSGPETRERELREEIAGIRQVMERSYCNEVQGYH